MKKENQALGALLLLFVIELIVVAAVLIAVWVVATAPDDFSLIKGLALAIIATVIQIVSGPRIARILEQAKAK